MVELRDIPREQAKREIMEFIRGKERIRADEIADALRIDLSLVNDILLELWEEGYVEPEGEKIRCVGRKVSEPRLIHQSRHRAIEIFVEGKPASRGCEGMEGSQVIK